MLEYVVVFVFTFLFVNWLLMRPFYWRGKVPYLLPRPLIGNAASAFTKGNLAFFQGLYDRFREEKVGGFHFCGAPMLILNDPKMIHLVLVEDADSFQSHGTDTGKYDPMAVNVFHSSGDRWKYTRSKLLTYFTPSKLKSLIDVNNSTYKLLEDRLRLKRNSRNIIDIQSHLVRFFTHSTVQSFYGVQSDAFSAEDSLWYNVQYQMFGVWFSIRFFMSMMAKSMYKLFRLSLFDMWIVRDMRKIIMEILPRKNKSDILTGLQKNMGERMGDKTTAQLADGLGPIEINMNFIVANLTLLFAAGTETGGSTVTFLLYELAKNPDIQSKLRAEVRKICPDGEVTYERIQDMIYMKMAIQETMRLYPIVAVLPRMCTKRYQFPDSDLVLEPNTIVQMGAWCIQRDPQYYPEPEAFKPERFAPGVERIPGTYFPFGLGPRMCLGSKVAMINMSYLVAKLLMNFQFNLGEEGSKAKIAKYTFQTTPASMKLEVQDLE